MLTPGIEISTLTWAMAGVVVPSNRDKIMSAWRIFVLLLMFKFNTPGCPL